MTTPNHAEFYAVCRELAQGQCLTLRHLIRVFGLDCADLLLYTHPTITVKVEIPPGVTAVTQEEKPMQETERDLFVYNQSLQDIAHEEQRLEQSPIWGAEIRRARAARMKAVQYTCDHCHKVMEYPSDSRCVVSLEIPSKLLCIDCAKELFKWFNLAWE